MKKIDPIPLINTTHKFVLYTNAKCGGTTLKSWFLGTLELEKTFKNFPTAVANYGLPFVLHWYTNYFGLHDATQILSSEKTIRFFVDCYRRSTKNLLPKIQQDTDYYQFAVVREPYSRIVSAFVDKFCGDDLHKPWVQEVILAVNKDSGHKKEINFQQFVDYLASHNNDVVNPHWRRQNYVMSDAKLDKVINLKDIQSGLADVSDKLQIPNSVKKDAPNQSQNYAPNKQQVESTFVGETSNIDLIAKKNIVGFFPAKEQFYNDQLKAKIGKIYQQDFERFSFEY